MTLLLMCIGLGSGLGDAMAENNTSVGTVYQYYLLDNRGGALDKTEKDKDKPGLFKGLATKTVEGILGTGGNQINFSYQDIINGAENKGAAQKFATSMATLSAYNYVTTKDNGLSGLLVMIGRFFIGLVLTVFGVVLDLTQNLSRMVITLLAKLNVAELIGGYLTGSTAGNELAKLMGLSQDTFATWAKAFFSMVSLVLLGTILWAVRRGATDVDRSTMHKARGRLFGIILLPATFILIASLTNDIMDITGVSKSTAPAYSQYLINSKAWAEKDNFDLDTAGFDASKSGNDFVDTSYDPYKPNSKAKDMADKIATASGIGKDLFANTGLALSYMTNQTFNGRDYLAYIEGGGKSGAGKSATLSQIFDKWSNANMYDLEGDKSPQRNSTDGSENTNWTVFNGDKKNREAIIAAKDDYVSPDKDSNGKPKGKGNDARSSFYKAWEARYIYGAKNTGDLKDYYAAKPSEEQIFNQAGAGSGDSRFSYESMFMILSTHFTPTGGTFSMDGPSYGAPATIARFDSNRVEYYDVSMVGQWLFTTAALLTTAITYTIVGMTLLIAFWSMGIVDMNLKPLRAWLKASMLGDMEYVMACLIYGVGLIGSIVTLNLVPPLLNDVMSGIPGLVVEAIGWASDPSKTSVQYGDYNINGAIFILEFALALALFIMFIKNVGGIRDKLVEITIMPWLWASVKGQQLEDSVSSEGVNLGKQALGKRKQRNAKLLAKMAKGGGDNKLLGALNNATGGAVSKFGKGAMKGLVRTGALDMGGENDANGTKLQNDLAAVERLGAQERLERSQRGLSKQLNKLDDPKDGVFKKIAEKDGVKNPKDLFALDPNKLRTENGKVKSLDEIRKEAEANGDEQTLRALNSMDPKEQAEFKRLDQEAQDLDKQKAGNDQKLAELNKIDPKNLSPEQQKQLEAAKQELTDANAKIDQKKQLNRQQYEKLADQVTNPAANAKRMTFARQNISRQAEDVQAKMQDFKKMATPANRAALKQSLAKLTTEANALHMDPKSLLGFDPAEVSKDIDKMPLNSEQLGKFGQIDSNGDGMINDADQMAPFRMGDNISADASTPTTKGGLVQGNSEVPSAVSATPKFDNFMQQQQALNRDGQSPASLQRAVNTGQIQAHGFDANYLNRLDQQVAQQISQKNRQGAEKLMTQKKSYLATLNDQGKAELTQRQAEIGRQVASQRKAISNLPTGNGTGNRQPSTRLPQKNPIGGMNQRPTVNTRSQPLGKPSVAGGSNGHPTSHLPQGNPMKPSGQRSSVSTSARPRKPLINLSQQQGGNAPQPKKPKLIDPSQRK